VTIHTIGKCELPVLQQLRHLGFCCWWPRFLTKNDRVWGLFPAYLFCQVHFESERWQNIYRAYGVRTVLGTHNERPATLPLGCLDPLMAQCGPDGVLYPREKPSRPRPAEIPAGVKVEIDSGRFAGWRGVCEWSSGTRAAVLLHALGGPARMNVPREDAVLA
jgi:transcription antitermination factor NusG